MKKLFAIGASILVLTGCETVPESPIPAGGSIRSTFLCEGGQSMTVDFADGLALLKANNAVVQLAQEPTGSGVHYTGGGYDLRGKGPDVTWTDPAGAAHQCRDVLATTSQTQASQPASLLGGTSWRLAQDVVRVRSYALRDGQLSLSLEADGGTYLWDPIA